MQLSRFGIVALVGCGVLFSMLPRVAGQDEFDDTAEPVAAPAATIAPLPGQTMLKESVDAQNTPRLTLGTRDWSMEVMAAAALIVYIAWYIIGRQRNRSIVNAFVKACWPTLRGQYAETTQSADDASSSPVIALSDAQFQIWASGRRNVCGMLMDLNLAHRQDLFSGVMAMVQPGSNADMLTIEVPLATAGSGFVLAIAPRSDRKTLLEVNKDLERFPGRVVPGNALRLPEAWDVLTESRDIAEEVLTRELAQTLSSASRYIKLFHITDLSDLSSMTTQKISVRALRLVMELPPQYAWEDTLTPLLREIHALVDRLPTMRLSKEAADRVKANRTEYQKELDRAAAKEAEEKRREQKEAEKQKEAARIAALDRETRKKLEEKERQKAMKSMMPRMKFKSR